MKRIRREAIDQPQSFKPKRRRMTKKQKAQAAAKRRACGTATTHPLAAGIKGRRRPKGTVASAGGYSYGNEAAARLTALVAAMTPANLPEPHRYRIG